MKIHELKNWDEFLCVSYLQSLVLNLWCFLFALLMTRNRKRALVHEARALAHAVYTKSWRTARMLVGSVYRNIGPSYPGSHLGSWDSLMQTCKQALFLVIILDFHWYSQTESYSSKIESLHHLGFSILFVIFMLPSSVSMESNHLWIETRVHLFLEKVVIKLTIDREICESETPYVCKPFLDLK